MPNWCEGKLKIRGKVKDIVRFFEKETLWVDFNGLREDAPIITTEYDALNLHKNYYDAFLKIKKSDRNHFLCNQDSYAFHEDREDDNKKIICIDFRCPWKFETEPFIQFSKRYHLDFKAYLFEGGAEFNCDLEIVDGKLVKNEIIEFENYVWDCIDPYLGG